LRNNSTIPENILWEKLRRRQILNTKFRRQVSIGIYIVDFFAFDLNLAIEVEGVNHQKSEQKNYDLEREKIIKARGVVFLKFTNSQVKENLQTVLLEIRRKIEEMRKITQLPPFYSP
jgi:very-short-patch-repair endonuclease